VTTRRGERLRSLARATVRRFAASAKRVLLTEPGSSDVDEAEVAEAQEIARSAAELKAGMAKVGQLMAYLAGPGAATDIEARRALAVLWDQAPAVDRAAIRQVITDDLGAPPEEVFAAWTDAPLAAASLGEVHAAESKTGVALAVKVQYPGVAEALRSDLESPRLLRQLAGSELGGALPEESIARLRDAVLAELDYLAEGQWMTRFRRAFVADKQMVIPRHFAELSSRRVLTAERIDGQPLTAFAAEAAADARAAVALTIFRFAWGGPLTHRLLNADPNPGNYLVLADGRVAFLDFGCAALLDEEVIDMDRKIWRSVVRRDGEALRYFVHKEGLLGRARTLDTSTYREWERYLAAPYLAKGPFHWTRAYARRFAELTSLLVRAGGLTLPPGAVLLWRQRLGVASVIGELMPTADFAGTLEQILAS
jgi:predicted unusual protein kinase regulating ubiquinone biosynthesis (AarF/ABC1/UbiB family)